MKNKLHNLAFFTFALILIAAVNATYARAQGPGGSTGTQPGGSTGNTGSTVGGGSNAIRTTNKIIEKRHVRSSVAAKQSEQMVAKAARPAAAPSVKSAPSPAAKASPPSDTFFNQGNDYYDRGLFKEAVEAYKRALELKPADAEAYSYLGDAYFNLRQYEDAIAAYKEAVRLNPKDSQSLYSMADAYANLSRVAEAKEMYAQAEQQYLGEDRKQGKVVSGGVLNVKAISLPPPVYPPIARAARASGTVVVEVIIDENGNVAFAKDISGHPLLRRPAADAALKAKFTPTLLSGAPVKVTGVIHYNFQLQ